MDPLSVAIIGILVTTLISGIGFMIKSSLSRIEKEIAKVNVKFDRLDSRADRLERFASQVKQAHNHCHPELPINGLADV